MKLKSATRPYLQRARAQSAEATARRILDAFLARLMSQWFDEITLDLIAADAGVTVQTVVRRFGSKEGLLSDAVKILGAQINAQRANPSGDIGTLVDHLIEDYEKTGDAVIRLLALEPRHAPLKEVLDFGRSEHREWVANAFAQRLGTLDAAARQCAIDALIINTDVYTWKLLRRDMVRSRAGAATMIKLLIQGTLSEFSEPKLKHLKKIDTAKLI
jgi:AcrR family transcriptional regulator